MLSHLETGRMTTCYVVTRHPHALLFFHVVCRYCHWYWWICFPGPFYVMMAPQDVLQSTGLGQRTLVPRSGIVPKLEPGSRVTRDDRRRATHNEGLLMLEITDWWFPVCSLTHSWIQGDHLSGKSGKPGNVRELYRCQGKNLVMEIAQKFS